MYVLDYKHFGIHSQVPHSGSLQEQPSSFAANQVGSGGGLFWEGVVFFFLICCLACIPKAF